MKIEEKAPHNPNIQEGWTLRDEFASSAMESLIISSSQKTPTLKNKFMIFFGINGWETNLDLSQSKIAKSAYELADSMLKQREQ